MLAPPWPGDWGLLLILALVALGTTTLAYWVIRAALQRRDGHEAGDAGVPRATVHRR